MEPLCCSNIDQPMSWQMRPCCASQLKRAAHALGQRASNLTCCAREERKVEWRIVEHQHVVPDEIQKFVHDVGNRPAFCGKYLVGDASDSRNPGAEHRWMRYLNEGRKFRFADPIPDSNSADLDDLMRS